MRPQAMSLLTLFVALVVVAPAAADEKPSRPNIVLILADDVGYGDVGCYGAKKVKTPNIDRLAQGGLRFTDGHSASATCTPTRYALLTGEYPFRKAGTGILPGDAALIIDPARLTLPAMLKKAGYATGVVGKWHLGLGQGGKQLDWNRQIEPGPREVGFDYSFIMPATGDRTPCVYVENGRVVRLDPADPIQVRYDNKFGDQPTGRENPELLRLKLRPNRGHDGTIVHGISRIGFMTGGKSALWVDENMADDFTRRAVAFIEQHRDSPFFLYFATHDIHVPQVPHSRFAGTSRCGVRGDVLEQLDSAVGEVLTALERLKLADNTLVIFSSDNGPIIIDAYEDGMPEALGDHRPSGPLKGGKGSTWEGGTRVPFIVRWPGRVRSGVSEALVSQIDLIASLAALVGQPLPVDAAPDSFDVLSALVGQSPQGREHLVEHAINGVALRHGLWKYTPPDAEQIKFPDLAAKRRTPASAQGTVGTLFHLGTDLAETKNVAADHPDIVERLDALARQIRDQGRSRP